MNGLPLISIVIFIPLAGAAGLWACFRRTAACRILALATMLVDLFFAALLLAAPVRSVHTPWLWMEDSAWIPAAGIRYSLAVDGVGGILMLLTAFLGVICVLVSWRHIQEKAGSYYFFLLTLFTGIMGVFGATDLFLFYLFWEIQIIPMFFLVGIWGHEERTRTTLKFILFTLAGGLAMLIALIALVVLHARQTGTMTFAFAALRHTVLPGHLQAVLFGAFIFSLGIKIPVVPLHTWLPDTHTQAPTAGSVILAGLLLKTGTYAVFRFALPLFPAAFIASAPLLMVLGISGLFYASWVALAQTDMKRLVAYSSIGHMGLVVLGLAVFNTVALNGALLQMINHGVSTSALFILVGMLDDRLDSRSFSDFGGLWKQMPVFSAFLLFFAMSSLGLPGLNNFVGEILILIGTFQSHPAAAVLGFTGLVLGVFYILKMVKRTIFGEPRKDAPAVPDLNGREILILGVLSAAVIFLGIRPQPVLTQFEKPVAVLLNMVHNAGPF